MKNLISTIISLIRVNKLRLSGIKIKSKVKLGKNVTIKSGTIESGVRIMPTSQINIGKNFYVNCNSHLCGTINLGDDVLLGPKVIIWSKNHLFENTEIPINQQGRKDIPITIEDDVWIGAGAIILQGVTVGKGSVIGAGSVVTKDTPPYSISVGNPAKVISSRK